jgi:putative transposase
VLSEHDVPISPSTYYAHRAVPVSGADWDDAQAANAVLDAYRANRSLYGVLELWAEMSRGGYDMGRDQVTRLMAIVGIEGIRRGEHRTNTTLSEPGAPRHPDLIKRQWTLPGRPDQWWAADFTYVWTLVGFCYVSFVTDVYSRRILGWRVSTSKTTELVASALQQALFSRRRHNSRFTATGLVHHSDAGSQYTSLAFTQALVEAGIAGSIGTVGDALDNALMESTIGLYKTELIYRHKATWAGRNEVETETASWVQWFNSTRLHSSINYLPPIEYEQRYRELAAADPTGEVA